eukprot:676140-Ditylum_brightwellii.AAC.1
MRLGCGPTDLPKHCDGYQKKISLQHALNCKVGGLVATQHNEVQNELVRVSTQAYSKSVVHDKPYIKNGCKCENDAASQNSPVTVFPTLTDKDGKLWGGVSIRGLWQRQMDVIIDVRVTNLDAKSYLSKMVKKCLEDQEKEKKDKYLSCAWSKGRMLHLLCRDKSIR